MSVGEAEFYAVVKGSQVGLSLRSVYMDLVIPMKSRDTKWQFCGKVSDRSILEQGLERSTSIRDASGYKNEFQMEISRSNGCLQRKFALLLERSQSLHHHHHNIANLQDW